MAAREIIPLRRLVHNIHKYSCVSLQQPDQFGNIKTPTLEASQVFEDNAACIVLANNENQFKARTKHISHKWHHFQDQIWNGNLRIVKVSTHFNWADILTKPLGPQQFESLRKLIMGWKASLRSSHEGEETNPKLFRLIAVTSLRSLIYRYRSKVFVTRECRVWISVSDQCRIL